MREFYFELTIKPQNSSYEIFNSLLLEIFDDAIEERDGSLILRSSEPLDDILWATNQLATKLNIKIETNYEKKRNEDWINSYKNSIQPIKVGNFYIHPEWESPKRDYTNIIINPALAFGSGHHETTYSCLKAIDKYVDKETKLLDVGTGSGILAIAANKKGAVVDICDTDELAIDSAIENFRLNNSHFNRAWVGSSNQTTDKYDVVIANIIADVILLINKELKSTVKSGGILILSGIIDKYFDKIAKKFNDFKNIETIKKDEWYTLVLRNE